MTASKPHGRLKKPRMAGGSEKGSRKRGDIVTDKAPRQAKKIRPEDKANAFEKVLKSDDGPTYILKLYVTGSTPHSVRAIENIKRICEDHLQGRYRLEIIDIYQQPELAAKEQLIVAPTLIRKLPLPLRTFIGDLSQTEKILVGLDLGPKIRGKM